MVEVAVTLGRLGERSGTCVVWEWISYISRGREVNEVDEVRYD